MSEPTVITQKQDSVAVVTLNRPVQRNALSNQLKRALLDALIEISVDDAVRAVVLTGSGSAFCVGQDLGEHDTALRADASTAFATVEEHYSPIVQTLATMPKPVVAAVNGTCVGAGLGFALACDLRVFSEAATLGTAFSGIGLTCDSGLSWTLARAVGDSRARELVLLARPFTPSEATGWGISGEIAPVEEVLNVAVSLARRLAQGPTLAYAESKALLAGSTARSLRAALVDEAAAQARCGRSRDHVAAVAAFLAKERPIFAGM